MGHRDTKETVEVEIVIVDGDDNEIASFELASETEIEIEPGPGLTDVTTDDEPEGVHILMIIPTEQTGD